MAGLEEHVTCSICMDLYNDPLALPCLHSFCRHCIQGMLSSSSSTLSCPDCRKEVDIGARDIDQLPRNFQLAGIVDSYKRQNEDAIRKRSNHIQCEKHKLNPELFCKTCHVSLCIKCITSEPHPFNHKLVIVKIRHPNDDVTRGDVICGQHERQFRLYCTECEGTVCIECIAQRHGSHVLAHIDDTYDYNLEILRGTISELDARVSLLKATQKTCRLMAQKTQSDAQKKRQELVTYFTRMRDILDRKEAQMKAEVDTREQKIVQRYMTTAGEARRNEKMVMNVMDDVKRLVTESKTVLLKHYKDKASKITDLLSDEPTNMCPQLPGVADVTLVTCSLDKELSTVQWRWHDEDKPVRPSRKAPPIPAERDSMVMRKLRPATARPRFESPIKVGSPVTRGRDWCDGLIDGGVGHVGSVTAVEVDQNTGDSTCTVRWPNGKTGQYTYGGTVAEIRPV